MHHKIKILLSIFFVGLLSTILFMGTSEKVTPKEVVIKFSSQATNFQVDSLSNALGLSKIKSIKEIQVDVFKISSDYSVSEVVQMCSSLPYVVYAEPTAQSRASSIAEQPVESNPRPFSPVPAQVAEFKKGEIIIKFKSQVGVQTINTALANAGIEIAKLFNEVGVYKCTIGEDKSVLKTVEECNANHDIEYAEPNYIYRTYVTPNDPRFSQLYGMTKIEAPQAWDVQTGSKSVIVGVIDTGTDTEHDDLKANIWNNPGETGGGKENNNVDDDGNGFVDDWQGWDFINDDNNCISKKK